MTNLSSGRRAGHHGERADYPCRVFMVTGPLTARAGYHIEENAMPSPSFHLSRAALLAGLFAGLFGLSPLGLAQSHPAGANTPPGGGFQGRDDRPPGPPPEALAACQGKQAGAPCNFLDREQRSRSGTCFQPPQRPAGGQAPQGPQAQAGGQGQGQRQSQGQGQGQGQPPMACRPDHGPGGASGPR